MNELQIFNFESNEVRTQVIDDEIWFVAKDVAEILGYSNTSDAIIRHISNEDKAEVVIHDGRQNRDMTIINESGMYALIFGSKLENAKKFKRWVTSEVLPSIRKTGSYEVPTDPMSALKLMFAATEQIDEEVKEVKTRVLDLEENVSLSPGEYNYVGKRVIKKVFQIGRERSYNMNKEQKAELFRALNREIAAITGVRTRTQLKQKHFDDVIDFIDDWEPSKATSVVVKQLELEMEM